MGALLLSPEFPDTFWSFKHAPRRVVHHIIDPEQRLMSIREMSYRGRYEAALPIDTFLENVDTLGDLWRGAARRAVVPPDVVEALAQTSGPWHLLVLLEDWCGDGMNTVPAIARLTELVPNVDLRVLHRDEHLDLMDAHLTDGTRSIPVVIMLDACYHERGWWGPRPAELQQWVQHEGRALSEDERYRAIRRWYARDRGQSALREIAALIEHMGENCAKPEPGRAAATSA
jgi:hypothetical protein